MLDWLANNWGTILVCAIIVGMIVLIVYSMIRDRKKGKSACGCGCESCAMNGACHAAKNAENNTENKNTPDASAKASEDKCEN